MCPINNTFRIMGKKFTVLILRNMMHLGQTRFNQFLEIEEINAKILSARLKEMEMDGLIKRKIFHERPVKVEYTLTDKGEALHPVLGCSLGIWYLQSICLGCEVFTKCFVACIPFEESQDTT
jgi:DNA-binding HxlR family transcriptional regulator